MLSPEWIAHLTVQLNEALTQQQITLDCPRRAVGNLPEGSLVAVKQGMPGVFVAMAGRKQREGNSGGSGPLTQYV